MTMEIELAKRDFVRDLWEEVRNDPAARELIFGEVLEDIEEDPPDDLREAIEEDVAADPPDSLREKIEQELVDDPSTALLDKAEEIFLDDPPAKLRDRIKENLRDEVEAKFQDQIDDLNREIERLRERMAELGSPDPLAKSAKVWR